MFNGIDERVASASAWAFEKNVGQYTSDIKYVLYKGRYIFLFFTSKILVGIRQIEVLSRAELLFFEISMDNISKETLIISEKEMSWHKKYLGEQPYKANLYERIRYKNIFQGIDLIFYINSGELEFDFVCCPGAEIKDISLTLSGIDSMDIDEDENIIVQVEGESLKILKPKALQSTENGSKSIDSEYSIDKDTIKFKLGNYDKEVTLIIDPVIVGSTYMGLSEAEMLQHVCVDNKGNYYGIGKTCSIYSQKNIISIGRCYINYIIFILKMNKEGIIEYFINLMGDYCLERLSLGVDHNEAMYISTETTLETAMKLNVMDRIIISGKSIGLCVLKIDSINEEVLYINFIGLPYSKEFGISYSSDIAVNDLGEVFVTGTSLEGDNWNKVIPSKEYFASGVVSKEPAATLYKINSKGDLSYFQLLAIGDLCEGIKIKIHNEKGIYMCGQCDINEASSNHYYIGESIRKNLYCANFNDANKAWTYITIIGGNNTEIFGDMDIDAEGNIYIVGRSNSRDFPIYPEGNELGTGEKGIFILKINSNGKILSYSMRIRDDFCYNSNLYIGVDSKKRAHITGYTEASDYPIKNGFDHIVEVERGGFYTVIHPSGEELIASTYLPCGDFLSPFSISTDSDETTYISGLTNASNVPMVKAWHNTLGSSIDTFILKIKNNSVDKLPNLIASPIKEKTNITNINNFDFNLRKSKDLIITNMKEIKELKSKIIRLEEQIVELSHKNKQEKTNFPVNQYYLTTNRIKLTNLSSKIVLNVFNNENIPREIELKVKSFSNRNLFSEKNQKLIVEGKNSKQIVIGDLYEIIEINLYIKGFSISVEGYEINYTRNEKHPIRILKIQL